MKETESRGLIQVAGIIDSAEEQMLMDAGVTYLGFPLGLTVHKEDISEEEARKIIRSLKTTLLWRFNNVP